LRELQNGGRHIDPKDRAVRRDCPCQRERSFSAAAPYVQNAFTRPRSKHRQSVLSERSKLKLQQFPNLRPCADPDLIL